MVSSHLCLNLHVPHLVLCASAATYLNPTPQRALRWSDPDNADENFKHLPHDPTHVDLQERVNDKFLASAVSRWLQDSFRLCSVASRPSLVLQPAHY